VTRISKPPDEFAVSGDIDVREMDTWPQRGRIAMAYIGISRPDVTIADRIE